LPIHQPSSQSNEVWGIYHTVLLIYSHQKTKDSFWPYYFLIQENILSFRYQPLSVESQYLIDRQQMLFPHRKIKSTFDCLDIS
jgi:hypothetical protein